jgi:hypothetical protein
MTNPAIELALSYFFLLCDSGRELVRTAPAEPGRFTVLNRWAMLCWNRVRKPIAQNRTHPQPLLIFVDDGLSK